MGMFSGWERHPNANNNCCNCGVSIYNNASTKWEFDNSMCHDCNMFRKIGDSLNFKSRENVKTNRNWLNQESLDEHMERYKANHNGKGPFDR